MTEPFKKPWAAPSEVPKKTAEKIAAMAAYERAKKEQPNPLEPEDRWYRRKPMAADREGTFLGIRWMQYHPSKDKPLGWSILRHRWVLGISLSYNPPPVTFRREYIEITDGGDYVGLRFDKDVNKFYRVVQNPITFWQRRLPNGMMWTLAKVHAKWRFSRSMLPFIDWSIQNAPKARLVMNEDGTEDYVYEEDKATATSTSTTSDK